MDLTEFMVGGPLELNILTIESSVYLPYLRRSYPNASLYAVTKYEEIINYPKYKNLNVNWILEEDIKIFPQKTFDIIIAESILTYTKNSYEDLMTINRALKETGYFLSSFNNIRYAPVIDEIINGRFPFRDEKLYAKDEVVKMLNDAIFKEIFFLPTKVGLKVNSEADLNAKSIADDLIKMGFQNYNNDLLTKTWMFKASVSTASVLALKELYTNDIRKNLAKLLHRIEYDVEREKNLAALSKFIEKEHIFEDYLIGFIEEICVNKENVRENLRRYGIIQTEDC